jgi:cation transport ATPase
MARLADRYSLVFSAVAIALASAAWWYSGSLDRALAVLVVATPCPLILGVPIALMRGVNRAARDKIIATRLAGLEILAGLSYLIAEKTGTITVGRPELVRIEPVVRCGFDSNDLLALTAAVERHSLHPIAKSLVEAAQARVGLLEVAYVQDVGGQGIELAIATGDRRAAAEQVECICLRSLLKGVFLHSSKRTKARDRLLSHAACSWPSTEIAIAARPV